MSCFCRLPPSPFPLKERSNEITRGLLGNIGLNKKKKKNRPLLDVGYASLISDILLPIIQFRSKAARQPGVSNALVHANAMLRFLLQTCGAFLILTLLAMRLHSQNGKQATCIP